MSCYSQERGTLVLPSVAVVPLRNALVDVVNKQRAGWLETASKIHTHLRSDAGEADRKVLSKLLRGKSSPVPGGSSLSDFFAKKIEQVSPSRSSSYGNYSSDNEESYDRTEEVMKLMLTPYKQVPRGEPPVPRKLQAPKKKEMAPLLASRTWSFSNGDCSITINPEKRTLDWYVDENNHAVERAWESLLGRTLQEKLSKIQWTRATGGAFRYSDEYARDAAMENGSNAVSLRNCYGPLGEQEREASYGLPLRRRSSPSRR
jgi:hypothetical protein